MTRTYFLECVTEWADLLELCRDEDCGVCEDIIDDDELDDYVESDISNSGYNWRSIRDFLCDIPTGYDYYRCDGSFDYVGLDNDGDFEDYKYRVLEWMDDNGLWEDEDDDDTDWEDYDFFSPGEEDEPTEPPVEEEDFSVKDLMSMCGAELVTICQVVGGRSEVEDVASLHTT